MIFRFMVRKYRKGTKLYSIRTTVAGFDQDENGELTPFEVII